MRRLRLSCILLLVAFVSCAVTPAAPETRRPVVPNSATFSPEEEKALSALCWVECRGMLDQRTACCSSVIDTVMTRIKTDAITDGTVIGTIRHGCFEDTAACQFPAYVTRGCKGITSPCPFYDEEGLALFEAIVRLYEEKAIAPICSGYIYYGLKPFDRPDCRIAARNGQWVNFHNGLLSDEKRNTNVHRSE